MYDGILFDKDGVLLNSCPDGFTWLDRIRVREARKRGYSIDIADAEQLVHSRSRQEVDDFLRSKGMTWRDFIAIERTISDTKIEAVKNGRINLFPNAVEVLESISAPKALVSNSLKRTAEFVLDYYRIGRFFEDVETPVLDQSGSFIEMKKPNTTMLENAVENLGLDNPVMIGDTSADVKAAEKMGIDSVLVDRHGTTGVDPTYRVDRLIDVEKVLQNKTGY